MGQSEGAQPGNKPENKVNPPSGGGGLNLSKLAGFLPDELRSRIAWLFLLLPGFFSYTATSLITPLEINAEFEVLALSSAFLLVNLAVASLIFFLGVLLASRLSKVSPTNWVGTRGAVAGFIILLFFTSIITGAVGGVMLERDIFFRFAKALPFLPVPIQDSILSPVDRILMQNQTGLNNYESPSPDGRPSGDQPVGSNQAMARITLRDGPVYDGYPLYFDSRKSQDQIYMTQACVVANSGNEIKVMPINGPGVVVYEREIESIVLLDSDATMCGIYWHEPPEKRAQLPGIIESFRYKAVNPGSSLRPSELAK